MTCDKIWQQALAMDGEASMTSQGAKDAPGQRLVYGTRPKLRVEYEFDDLDLFLLPTLVREVERGLC